MCESPQNPRLLNSFVTPARSVLRACLLLLVLLNFTACQTIQPQSVVSWREAVQASKEQSRVTFEAVERLVRESKLNRIETLPPGQLEQISEEDVSAALPPKSVRQWNTALGSMAAYAAAVEALLSPDLPQGVGESLKRTGERLGATADIDELKSDKKLSELIGTLGRQIVAAAANRNAREAMLQIDPTIKQLTEHMADMLYGTRPRTDEHGKPITQEAGVLVTVRVTWKDRLTAVQEKFRDTTVGSDRRTLAQQYAELLDERERSEEAVMALRRGILDLGAAHTAAAQGRAADVRALVAMIREDIALTSALLESLKKD